MQTSQSPAYLAFQEVMNRFVSGEKIRRVAQMSERFLCFSDPEASRPMVHAVRMSARAAHAELSEQEFDQAVRQAEARVAIVPRHQMNLF
jgi:hypothetical protein